MRPQCRRRRTVKVFWYVRATKFEERHAMLLHQFVVAVAFLTYLWDRDDVVWRFIKDNAANRVLEHALFAVATLLVGGAAIICTRARVYPDAPIGNRQSGSSHSACNWRYLGDFLYAIGLVCRSAASQDEIQMAGSISARGCQVGYISRDGSIHHHVKRQSGGRPHRRRMAGGAALTEDILLALPR